MRTAVMRKAGEVAQAVQAENTAYEFQFSPNKRVVVDRQQRSGQLQVVVRAFRLASDGTRQHAKPGINLPVPDWQRLVQEGRRLVGDV